MQLPKVIRSHLCHNLLCNNNFVGFLTRDVASEEIILCAKTRS